MTHFLSRTALLAFAAVATSAVAAPTYPIRKATPPAPVTARAPAPAPDPVEMDENGDPVAARRPAQPADLSPEGNGDVQTAPAAGTVQSRDLPPPAPRTQAPPPAPTPSSEPNTAPPPLIRTERLQPTPVPATVTKVITLAPGKVIDIDGRPKTYTVKEGQGLDAVARAMGSSRAELAKINGLKEPYKLKPGQVLKGPASRAKAYVVASGDTLFVIARRFNVKASVLADENDLTVNSAIRPGQKLRLPAGYKDSGPIKKTVTVESPTAPPPIGTPVRPPVTTPVEPVVKPPVRPPVTTPTPTPTLTPPPPPVTTPAVRPPVKPPVTTPPVTPPVRPPVETPPMTSVRLDPDCATRLPRGPTGAAPGPSSDRLLPDGSGPGLSDDQIAALGKGCFAWPTQGSILSAYGPKGGGQRNDGLNISAPAGTPVRAAASGKVVYSGGDVPGFGVTVLIQHENGWVTVYGHLAKADVRMQQQVAAGQQIGSVGATGGVSQPQLHFEIRYSPSAKYKAKAVDPGLVLPRNR